MQNITRFDINAHHIYTPLFIISENEEEFELNAVLDTGAPVTEIYNTALVYAGLLEPEEKEVTIKPGLLTQKYGKLTLPNLKICGHELKDQTIYVSQFDYEWGVDALIGLDFFKKFRVTIDYKQGLLVTESY